VTNIRAIGLPVFIAVWRLQKNLITRTQKKIWSFIELEYARPTHVFGTAPLVFPPFPCLTPPLGKHLEFLDEAHPTKN